MKNLSPGRRLVAGLLALGAAALLAGRADAKINVIYVTHTSGPELCDHFTSNNLDYERFIASGDRIPLPRGTTIRVTMLGFGADFATGTTDNVTNLRSSIVAHGRMDDPAGGIHFGQRDQIGYVTVEIRSHADAELGNGHVTVNWATGHETIPLKIVASCGPAPTPRPASTPPPPPRPLVGVAAPAAPQLPDLTPTDFVNVRTCNPSSFGTCVPGGSDCNGAFTGQRRFQQADLQFGVRNISSVDVTTPFAVLLRKRDGTQLQKVNVAALAANATRTFTFHRPNSEVCVEQIGPNRVCTYCAVAIDDTGIEVVVDSDNALAEASETNNSRKIQ